MSVINVKQKLIKPYDFKYINNLFKFFNVGKQYFYFNCLMNDSDIENIHGFFFNSAYYNSIKTLKIYTDIYGDLSIIKKDFSYDFYYDTKEHRFFNGKKFSDTIKYLQKVYKKETILCIVLDKDFLTDELIKLLITVDDLNAILPKENRIYTYFDINFNMKFNDYIYFMKNIYMKYYNSVLPYSENSCENCKYRNVIKNNKFYFCEKYKFSKIATLGKTKFSKSIKKYILMQFIFKSLNKKFFNIRSSQFEPNKCGCFSFGKYNNAIYNDKRNPAQIHGIERDKQNCGPQTD